VSPALYHRELAWAGSAFFKPEAARRSCLHNARSCLRHSRHLRRLSFMVRLVSSGSHRWQNWHAEPFKQPRALSTKEHGLHRPLPCDEDPTEGMSAACRRGGAEAQRRGGGWSSSGSAGSSRKVFLTRKSFADTLAQPF